MKVNIKIETLVLQQSSEKKEALRSITELATRLNEIRSDVGIGYEEVLNFIETESSLAESGTKSATTDLARINYKQIDTYLIQVKHILKRVQELQEAIALEAKPEGQ
jgi:hypothetical protein